MKSYLISAFLFLGGAALIWRFAKKELVWLVDMCFELLDKFPKLKLWVIGHKKELLEAEDLADKEFDKKLEELQ
jgi:hypothetical protein